MSFPSNWACSIIDLPTTGPSPLPFTSPTPSWIQWWQYEGDPSDATFRYYFLEHFRDWIVSYLAPAVARPSYPASPFPPTYAFMPRFWFNISGTPTPCPPHFQAEGSWIPTQANPYPSVINYCLIFNGHSGAGRACRKFIGPVPLGYVDANNMVVPGGTFYIDRFGKQLIDTINFPGIKLRAGSASYVNHTFTPYSLYRCLPKVSDVKRRGKLHGPKVVPITCPIPP